MKHNYEPSSIETKWQDYWEANATFRVSDDIEELKKKPKAYILDMFPYPSGQGLHVGHPKGYTASDVIARLRRMQGYNVLHPMGWDAFGLPAERAAERERVHPSEITERNVSNFRRQLKRVGFSYDWHREINTAQPDYYKWTQWIFLKLAERDLAYMADVPVNWCPALGTVLANEEVKDGRYIETGDLVERRLMRQWMLKITAYAERLIEDLDDIDWPESLKNMQRHWIGRSEGARITFSIQGSDYQFEVFTTRPDTLFGATYCILSPEHPLVTAIVSNAQQAEVNVYVERAKQKSDLLRQSSTEKTGVFSGAYAINPVNGQAIPIWIADYVLISYGTGAMMSVPAHDERDHEFALKFELPIIPVVEPSVDYEADDRVFVGEGTVINSDFLNGLATDEAKSAVIGWLEERGHGTSDVQYRLRDWLFSRQRYWGEPFPIIHLDDGNYIPVPEDQLPVELPQELEDKDRSEQSAPLANSSDDWLIVTLPDGRVGMRETNTMPQWAGSCWYYLRYIDPHNAEQAWHPELEQYWMPVDLYIGGVEHAVLHLLYSRFWHKILYDCGLVSTKEPFQQLFNQGMILANSYQDSAGKYYLPHDVEQVDEVWVSRADGQPLSVRMEKMSKSRHNVFGLDDVIDEYGADALRLYELFIGPLSASGPWDMQGIHGVYRFLERVWRLFVDERTGAINANIVDDDPTSVPGLNKVLHQSIQSVTEGLESLDKMNTAISQLMIFINNAASYDALPHVILEDFLRLLAPMAPHIAEELWARLGHASSIAHSAWPSYDVEFAAEDQIELPIQINGAIKARIQVAIGKDKTELEQIALAHPDVQSALANEPIKRTIVVPDKIINIVI